MEKNWVKIYTTFDFYQAELIRQVLVDYHIETVLLNKQDSSHKTFGLIEIYIHQNNFSMAIEILIKNEL